MRPGAEEAAQVGKCRECGLRFLLMSVVLFLLLC